jgi:hypothetical protein
MKRTKQHEPKDAESKARGARITPRYANKCLMPKEEGECSGFAGDGGMISPSADKPVSNPSRDETTVW